MLVKDILKDKKFPNWFKDHSIFKKVYSIKKVFPGIGLPNCEAEFLLDNNVGPAYKAATHLIKNIDSNISNRIVSLKKYILSKPEMSEPRKFQGTNIIILLEAVEQLMSKRSSFITNNNGRFSLKLYSNVFVDNKEKPIYREGESLFRVYNKLNQALESGRFAKMRRLEEIQSFKTFSTDNLPNNKFKIVFSSDGIDGAWDVATMSMRGIKSCQSWDGEYRHCVIGSVIDPFVGIIYLTSGAKFGENGSRMIRRSIVRFVVDSKNNKPFLLLDNMYPDTDTVILKQFKKFLFEKTGGKFDVQYAPNMDHDVFHNTYMPLTEVRKLLKETNRYGDGKLIGHDLDTIASYQDARIIDKTSNKNDKQELLYQKNVSKKINKFITNFTNIFTDAFKQINIDKFPQHLKPLMIKFKGGDKKNFSYLHIISKISNSIAKDFVLLLNKDEFMSSDLFIKRVYYSYFLNKKKIINSLKDNISKEINSSLALSKKEKISADQFLLIMNLIFPIMDSALKLKLNEIISADKNKTSGIIPLP